MATDVRRRAPLSAALQREIFVRDGWICGYCGIRTVDPRARKRLVALTGIPWGDRDAARHAALLNVSAVVDHVHPAAAYASTVEANHPTNLVCSCWT
jgi:hypothetical protein